MVCVLALESEVQEGEIVVCFVLTSNVIVFYSGGQMSHTLAIVSYRFQGLLLF